MSTKKINKQKYNGDSLNKRYSNIYGISRGEIPLVNSQTRPGSPTGYATRPGSPIGYATRSGSPTGYATRPGSPTGYATRPGSPIGYATRPGSPTGYATRPGSPTGYATRPGSPTGYATRPGSQVNLGGAPSFKKVSKKEILGKNRVIYKMKGSNKEYIKNKGLFIPVVEYKKRNRMILKQ